MLRTRIALALGALSLLAVGPLAAQTCATNPCTVQLSTSATVTDVLRLTLNTITTDLGTPIEADYDAGYRDASGPTASVKSNRPWHVSIVGAASSFGYTGSLTNPNKSASDLKWGTVSGSYGNDMSAAANLFAGNGGSGFTQAIFFRTLYSYAADVPGTYSLTVNFTLSAP